MPRAYHDLMKEREIHRQIEELLEPMTGRYRRKAKVAPHLDEALRGVRANDRGVTDRGLRGLYMARHRLGDLEREQVLLCLKLRNSDKGEGRTRLEPGDNDDVKRTNAIRRHRNSDTFGRVAIVVGGLALGGVALLAPREFVFNPRFAVLATLLLLLAAAEVWRWWRG